MVQSMRRETNRRLFTWAILGGFTAVVTVASLSDRAPRFVPRITDLTVRVGRRFEAVSNTDLVDVSSIPGRTDQIGHFLLWGAGMLAIGWLTRKRIPVAATACLLFAASIAVEFLQVRWTATRQLEVTDAVANGLGILLAAIAVATLGAAVDLVVRLWRWFVPAIS